MWRSRTPVRQLHYGLRFNTMLLLFKTLVAASYLCRNRSVDYITWTYEDDVLSAIGALVMSVTEATQTITQILVVFDTILSHLCHSGMRKYSSRFQERTSVPWLLGKLRYFSLSYQVHVLTKHVCVTGFTLYILTNHYCTMQRRNRGSEFNKTEGVEAAN